MRNSEITAFIDELSDSARVEVRELLTRAYERGFREGLSAAGSGAEAGPPLAVVAQSGAELAAPSATPIALPAPAAEHTSPAGVAWAEDADEPGDDEASLAEPARPIMVHATVGTLMRRIEQTFALERFDIEVVVCRRGDRDRRQLKSPTRLKNYLRER